MRTGAAQRVLVLSVRTHLEKKERHSGRDRTSGTLFTLSSITYFSAGPTVSRAPIPSLRVEAGGVKRRCLGIGAAGVKGLHVGDDRVRGLRKREGRRGGRKPTLHFPRGHQESRLRPLAWDRHALPSTRLHARTVLFLLYCSLLFLCVRIRHFSTLSPCALTPQAPGRLKGLPRTCMRNERCCLGVGPRSLHAIHDGVDPSCLRATSAR